MRVVSEFGVDCRPGSEERVNCNMSDMRDEFDWYLSLATENSMYPYNKVLIPKIDAISNLLFTKDIFYTSNDRLAAKLLERQSPAPRILTFSNPFRSNIIRRSIYNCPTPLSPLL